MPEYTIEVIADPITIRANNVEEAIERAKEAILKHGVLVVADRVYDDDEIEALEKDLYWEPEGASVGWKIAEAFGPGEN